MLDPRIRELFPYLHDKLDLRITIAREQPRLFLDNTASTQVSLPVLEALARTVLDYANVHRGEYRASQLTTERFEAAYNVAANLVNAADANEIVFGRNTTEMINLVQRALEADVQDGDNVVVTRLEHNSNYVPWYGMQQRLLRRGVNVDIRIVDFNKETGALDMDQLARLVDTRTKIVATTGASNFMGVRPDIHKIAEIAHASGYQQQRPQMRGSFYLVDGAQLVPGTPVDVQAIGCDFLTWSFHKMTLPFGIGGLYAKAAVLEELDPFLYGGDMIDNVQEGNVTYKKRPWRYTAGTPNILGTIATGEGIAVLVNMALGNLTEDDEVERIGRSIETAILLNTPRGVYAGRYSIDDAVAATWRNYIQRHPDTMNILKDKSLRLTTAQERVRTAMTAIQRHEEELTQYALDSMHDIESVTIYGPRDATKRAGLVAFNIQGYKSEAAVLELDKRGIEARNGTHCASLAHNALGLNGTVRISFYVYNTKDDVGQAVDAIKEIPRG